MVMTKDVSCVPKACLTFDVMFPYQPSHVRTAEPRRSTRTFRPGNSMPKVM